MTLDLMTPAHHQGAREASRLGICSPALSQSQVPSVEILESLSGSTNNSLSLIPSAPSTNQNRSTQESTSVIEVSNLGRLILCCGAWRGAAVICFYLLYRCVCWSVRVASPARSHGRCANTLWRCHGIPPHLGEVLCPQERERSWGWPRSTLTPTTNCWSRLLQRASGMGIWMKWPLSSAASSMTHRCWGPLRRGRECGVSTKRGNRGRRGTRRSTAS